MYETPNLKSTLRSSISKKTTYIGSCPSLTNCRGSFQFHFASTPPAKGTLTCSRILRITLWVEEAWEASSRKCPFKVELVFDIRHVGSKYSQHFGISLLLPTFGPFFQQLKKHVSTYMPNWFIHIIYTHWRTLGFETSSTRRNVIIVAMQSNWFTITCVAVVGLVEETPRDWLLLDAKR